MGYILVLLILLPWHVAKASIEATASRNLLEERRLRHHDHHSSSSSRHHHHNEKDRDQVATDTPVVPKDDSDSNPPHPAVQSDTQHGMMIDAGSQGTRIHVYEFEPRVLKDRQDIEDAVSGRKLSFPTTNSRWTDRLVPGLDSFAYQDENMTAEVREYLTPLLDFAKEVLAEKQEDWRRYPIYLKATGGLRTLPQPYRLRLMEVVRSLFFDKSFNPFFFEEEHARVISGEEEAIYGWTAVNFAMGTLIENSRGSGSVLNPILTYGVLEMGGASTQIGFYEPNGDVMADLFKLQIGASKHWNVYCHSFLYFGINGAFERLSARLFTHTPDTSQGVYNPCLPGRSQLDYASRVHMLPDESFLPFSAPDNASVLEAELYVVNLYNDADGGDPLLCRSYVRELLQLETNRYWCDFAHDRDCSIAGTYQPPLPFTGVSFAEFILTSNFFHVGEFLGLSSQPTVEQFDTGAQRICSMSWSELLAYNATLDSPIADEDQLKQYCFRTTFAASFLQGIGFQGSYNVTVADVLNGQKLGWALGSVLYEINTLPWNFKRENKILHRITPDLLADYMLYERDRSPSSPQFSCRNAFFLGLFTSLLVAALWRSKRTIVSDDYSTGSG